MNNTSLQAIQMFREVTINRLRNLSPIMRAKPKLSFRYDGDDDDDGNNNNNNNNVYTK